MGKLKNAARFLGEMAEAAYDRNQKIDEMTREIMNRSYGLDAVEARKVAAVLVDRATVTWK